MIVAIGQHDLFAGHPFVIDDDWRFEIDGRLQRVFRNDRNHQLHYVVVVLNFKAMEILKGKRAHIGTKNQMWINDWKGHMLVLDRLQPFERHDLFVLDEDVALVLGKAQHSLAKLQDSFVFVLQRAKRLSFQFQRNDYLR